MKNLVLVFLFSLFFVQFSDAQTTMTNSGDTVVNTATVNLDVTLKGKGDLGFQVVATKISGTVGGTAILQGSLDGTNYVTISTDTLTLTDVATNSAVWKVSASTYLYYRIAVTGSGTMSASVVGYALRRE